MSREEHYRKLERMYLGAPANRYFSPTLRIEKAEATITIPVREEFFHAAGSVHGSVYFKALDDAAYFAASSLVDDVFLFTVTFQIYLVRPVSSGAMKATGRVAHRSRRVLIAEAELLDDRGREIARGSGTFMKSDVPLSEKIGYR